MTVYYRTKGLEDRLNGRIVMLREACPDHSNLEGPIENGGELLRLQRQAEISVFGLRGEYISPFGDGSVIPIVYERAPK